jgi:hypothetical protein
LSIRSMAFLAIIAVLFGAGLLGVIVMQRGSPPPARPAAAPKPFDGKLAIPSIDDLRVGGRKILLCGAAFSRPQAMRALVTKAARRDYQGLILTCKPVGAGTPCDGKIASRFGDTLVVQCLTAEGEDLATMLTQGGILCGQPPLR